MVASWSVDRLGRSLTDLLGILQNLHEKGVGLFLHQQGLDTSTSAGKAMFQMVGVFAEFERGIIRERVNAGASSRQGRGTKPGRRRVESSVEVRIGELRANGDGILKIGRKLASVRALFSEFLSKSRGGANRPIISPRSFGSLRRALAFDSFSPSAVGGQGLCALRPADYIRPDHEQVMHELFQPPKPCSS